MTSGASIFIIIGLSLFINLKNIHMNHTTKYPHWLQYCKTYIPTTRKTSLPFKPLGCFWSPQIPADIYNPYRRIKNCSKTLCSILIWNFWSIAWQYILNLQSITHNRKSCHMWWPWNTWNPCKEHMIHIDVTLIFLTQENRTCWRARFSSSSNCVSLRRLFSNCWTYA